MSEGTLGFQLALISDKANEEKAEQEFLRQKETAEDVFKSVIEPVAKRNAAEGKYAIVMALDNRSAINQEWFGQRGITRFHSWFKRMLESNGLNLYCTKDGSGRVYQVTISWPSQAGKNTDN